MKEIADIIKAHAQARKDGKKTALATVVKVEGSSYRRPGARMLITEDGILTGAISGGCLEGDALRKALSAIHQQENKLVTYDSMDEDDAKFGVQLGCNGIVYILFEPIFDDQEVNPITILAELESKRKNAALAVLFSLEGKKQIGTYMLLRQHDQFKNKENEYFPSLSDDLQQVLAEKKSTFLDYNAGKELITAFLEFISPPIALIIAGAGNDAQPLANIADILGWNVTIADGRLTHATSQRFPKANQILVAKPGQLLQQITIDENTAFVLMTHNYNYDLKLLDLLLPTNAPYIGSLGPKKKLIRMLDELNLNTDQNQSRVHGPIGLDIGAETAEEIAISIVAEIKAVLSGATAGRLKEKIAPIHVHEIKNN
ncbi:XdhC/CoxI family protein [Pedobacter psychrotolerans]|uniref:Xanthine dehydrogenase subunit A n=1 Tax=Pedobacter psychrotolerans TaxID=1843235 RepID=A0A4R2HDB7_9SPHI|nr:XdhC/CoxI family protein [Pedobacter psychrotolerans]TCO25472.1 XdhC/CoxI family protein [Pedobacter psychrotolerans]GGE45161.1 putative xanthine dehydrogenase subunit A [Pedobacter psychrotolerans]